MAESKAEKAEKKVQVVWEGRAGLRRLSVADLKLLGATDPDGPIEAYRGIPFSVPENVAKVLKDPRLEGGFKVPKLSSEE